ncbi:hypothetical protein [Streptomyces sp. 7N604]|uniref:hypothetical protein n=1 Tax=Streptomyces sp. 7N604 TaxID=3457415 RepID=UPI003FD18F1A
MELDAEVAEHSGDAWVAGEDIGGNGHRGGDGGFDVALSELGVGEPGGGNGSGAMHVRAEQGQASMGVCFGLLEVARGRP